jgi:ADP-heptose:LPS heptosyltransferase
MPRCTLVVFPGALGDFVCFLPTLRYLRERCADDSVTLVAQSQVLPLGVRPGLADDGVAVERAAVAQLFVAGSKVPLLPRSDIGNVYSWFASADAVVRENLTVRAHGTVRCAPFRLPSEYSGHVTQHFFGGAAAPDGAGAAPVPRLPLLAAEHRGAGKFWRRHGLDGRPVLAVHRGASAPAKRWAEDGYRAVTQWWRERGGAVLEVCGPLESPVPLSPEHVLARDLALGDLAALLARVDLFLGGDTGVSHLAGAVGAAGVVLFGPWRPADIAAPDLASPRDAGARHSSGVLPHPPMRLRASP